LTISLVLPALNVSATIGEIICIVLENLVERVPLLDEVVVMDSNSHDETRLIVESFGLPVYIHQNILSNYGSGTGKGEAIWKSLFVTHGDLICWIDSDIRNFSPHFVYGLVGPLLEHPGIHYVKGFYRRPIQVRGQTIPMGGGRVTELCARPMLNLFFPQLSGIIQPLSGEYCGRRSILETLPFCSGYAVETGLLIDILNTYGLNHVAQVDLYERIHQNRPLESLSAMSFSIIQTVLSRIDALWGTNIVNRTYKHLTQVHNQPRDLYLYSIRIDEHTRPPASSIPEYK
jgi:glucosyl-3-phosphoglycerate synthase